MGKKRKTDARHEPSQSNTEVDPRDSRKRIRNFEDVADSDDEFHLNRDEVKLGEEPDAKRRRKWAEQEEFLQQSDEEVLGFSQEEEQNDDEEAAASIRLRQKTDFNGSDEGEDDRTHRHEDEEFGWGTSKADLYGADAIETEEQALEEEAEALRLQKKHLESMNVADYGFDEDEWNQTPLASDIKAKRPAHPAVVTEILPQLQITPDAGPVERLKILKTRYPEFELFSKDLLLLSQEHARLQTNTNLSLSGITKMRAASAYLGALVMYFALLTSTSSSGNPTATALPATQIRDHSIMDTLMDCRETWASVAKLPEGLQELPAADLDLKMDEGLDNGSLDEEVAKPQIEAQHPQKTRAQRHAEATQAALQERRADRLRRTEASLADLDALTKTSARKNLSKKNPAVVRGGAIESADLGEEAALTLREAEDKAKRKKSLRFYTSQIAQKANKRGAAGRNAGGDDDIPHRERLRDRQARLNAEAEKRGARSSEADAELGGDSDEEDRRLSQQIRAEADDDDYYDLVAARTTKKKGDKAALAEAHRQAALQGGQVVQEETVGEDGKRKISYAIEKNKGLTPHRKKDVRNPRVKKRKKFEASKKKLASIKPVYKGGEGRGGYGGELTGIKKGLVKSTKL